MRAWTKGSEGSAPLGTVIKMKQAKSILFRYIIEVEGEKRKRKKMQALTRSSVTMSKINGIYRNTNS